MYQMKENSLKISVVIPVYNHWDLVHSRLNELYHHVPQDTEVIIVNDNSPDEDSVEIVTWWKENALNGRLFAYKNKENLGFGGTCNRGFDLAVRKHNAEGVCILSTDVTIFDDFVSNVKTLLTLNKQILIGGELLYNDTGWNVLDGCGVVPYANGWFIATHKDTWQVLGGFDIRYGKFDYEDIDLSTSAWMNGIKLVPCGSRFHHASGVSIRSAGYDRLKYTLVNQKTWQEKWSDKAQELKEKIYGH